MRVQFRWPVGMPLCRAIGGGLWEVRTDLSSNRIARTLFSVHDERIVVLHGFIKKTQRRRCQTMTSPWRVNGNGN